MNRSAGKTQAGFTMIEVMIAMLLALTIIGALAAAYVSNSDASLANQRQTSLLSIAQQQIENVRQIVKQNGGFGALAMTAYPSTPTDTTLPANPTDPNDFVKNDGTSSASLLIETNYNATAGGQISGAPANGEPLLVNGANSITGGQITPLQYADLTTGAISPTLPVSDPYASVYTYVTQASSVNSGVSGCAACAGDIRRIVVAVKLQQAPGHVNVGPNAPLYTSTLISNPIPSNQNNSAAGLRLGLNIG